MRIKRVAVLSKRELERMTKELKRSGYELVIKCKEGRELESEEERVIIWLI